MTPLAAHLPSHLLSLASVSIDRVGAIAHRCHVIRRAGWLACDYSVYASYGRCWRAENQPELTVSSSCRLFVRTKVDLAPFAYEVPPELARHTELLRELGAADEPSGPQLRSALAAFEASHRGAQLNVNQCLAVARLLTHLTTALLPVTSGGGGGGGVGDLPVLTADARLALVSRRTLHSRSLFLLLLAVMVVWFLTLTSLLHWPWPFLI